jgi:putative ABC transport system ATP-binding protein
MDLISAENLTVAYTQGDYVVKPIDGLDAVVEDGELVLLLGPSGSGKTTLLSCLSGILKPTSGRIEVNGIDVTALDAGGLAEYRRETVGIVFQGFNLIAGLSALENVMAPLRLAGVRRRQAGSRAAELLEMVDLTHRIHHQPSRLSGGQQQRVAIARALAHDPPVIIADEPTAHLDYVQVEGIARLLRTLAAPGRAVVVSTHDDRLLPLADRVIDLSPRPLETATIPQQLVLRDGEVLFRQGDAADFIWVVDEGALVVYRTRPDGGDEQLAEITAGSYVGEMGPLLRLPRSASARAAGDTIVSPLSVRDFKQRFSTTRTEPVINLSASG